MTDRELLEKAAKSAGYSVRLVLVNGDLDIGADKERWNPLTDDGDALRLAVKLGLTICNEHESSGAVYCTRGETEDFEIIHSGNVGDPPGVTASDFAATRRAIVVAAAALAP